MVNAKGSRIKVNSLIGIIRCTAERKRGHPLKAGSREKTPFLEKRYFFSFEP